MILGRLFEQLFAVGTVIVATSNAAPDRLYEGGINRQLFLPFIAEIKQRLEVVELNGPADYRLKRLTGMSVYLTPAGPAADAGMDAAWARLTDGAVPAPQRFVVLGRELNVPGAAGGVARFSFADLCEKPLAAPDYLTIARHFDTVLIDHIPVMREGRYNEARRFVVLIDTLYDEGVKLVCSAAAAPEALYPKGRGAVAFGRAASRLAEMGGDVYLGRGHGIDSADA
jgi:cell division protein ZapE